MPFIVDDRFHSDPRVLATSLAARGLWVSVGAWSSDHGKSGAVPDHVLAALGSTPELRDELVATGLVRRIRRGVLIADWELLNETAEKAAQREADAGRKRDQANERQRRRRDRLKTGEARDVTRDSDVTSRMSRTELRTRNGKPQAKGTPVTRDTSVTARDSHTRGDRSDFDLDQSLGAGKSKSRSKSTRARDPEPGTSEFRVRVAAEFAGAADVEIDDATADALAAEVLAKARPPVPRPLGYVLKAINDEPDPRARWLPKQPARAAFAEPLPHCGDPLCSPKTRRREHPETGADAGPCPKCSGSAATWKAS